MALTSITMRIEEDLKSDLQNLVSSLGMDMTTFFTISAKQAVREQRIPFEISMRTPNEETLAAIDEVRELKKNPNKKTYGSFEELLEDLA